VNSDKNFKKMKTRASQNDTNPLTSPL